MNLTLRKLERLYDDMMEHEATRDGAALLRTFIDSANFASGADVVATAKAWVRACNERELATGAMGTLYTALATFVESEDDEEGGEIIDSLGTPFMAKMALDDRLYRYLEAHNPEFADATAEQTCDQIFGTYRKQREKMIWPPLVN